MLAQEIELRMEAQQNSGPGASDQPAIRIPCNFSSMKTILIRLEEESLIQQVDESLVGNG